MAAPGPVFCGKAGWLHPPPVVHLAADLQITWPTWLRYSMREVLPEARPSTHYSPPPCHPAEVTPPCPGPQPHHHVTALAELLLACMLFPGYCQPPASGALVLALPPTRAPAGPGAGQNVLRPHASCSLQTAQRLLSQKAALSPHQARAGLGQAHRSQCLALRTTWQASSYR